MAGVLLLMLFVILSAIFEEVVSGETVQFPAGVLTLERMFPLDQKVELEELKARDRARHARILQSFAGGVVDFSVYGTSDPYLVGSEESRREVMLESSTDQKATERKSPT